MRSVPTFSLLAVSPVAEAGGAEVLLIDILAGLQAAGIRVSLLVLGKLSLIHI